VLLHDKYSIYSCTDVIASSFSFQ